MRGRYCSRCHIVMYFICPDYVMGPKVVERRPTWKTSELLNLKLYLNKNISSHISENRPPNHYYTINAAFEVQII